LEIDMAAKKYNIRGPLAERLEEAAENEEMSSEDLLDYIVRRYLDDLWVCEEESDEEESENEEEA
jgi:hypothetical protein